MIIFLIFVIIGLLIYIITTREKKEVQKEKTSYKELLPIYLDKKCEITLHKPLMLIDIPFSVVGIVADFDDEWIAVRVTDKKRSVLKIFRIDNVGGIKEIQN